MPPCLLDLSLCSPSLLAINIRKKDLLAWDFPGGPLVKTLSSQCRGQGSVPGEGTRSHMPQLKISCATTKTQHSQINIFLKKEKKCMLCAHSHRLISMLLPQASLSLIFQAGSFQVTAQESMYIHSPSHFSFHGQWTTNGTLTSPPPRVFPLELPLSEAVSVHF